MIELLNAADKLVSGLNGDREECGAGSQLVLSASLDCSVCIWCLDSG